MKEQKVFYNFIGDGTKTLHPVREMKRYGLWWKGEHTINILTNDLERFKKSLTADFKIVEAGEDCQTCGNASVIDLICEDCFDVMPG